MSESAAGAGPSGPPVASVRTTVHELHGVRRVDHYDWMRDATSAEVLAYLAAERAYYDASTSHLRSLQHRIFVEMSERVLPADQSVSWARRGHVYSTRTLEGRDYTQLLRKVTGAGAADAADAADAAWEVILDENELASGQEYCRVAYHEPSPDGRLLAYAVDLAGDEVYTLRFRELASGQDLPDVVEGIHYTGGAWTADSSAFYYTFPDAAWRSAEVRRHHLGTSAGEDVTVLAEVDERFNLELEESRSGSYVVVHSQSRTTSEAYLIPTADSQGKPVSVAPRRDGVEYSIAHAPHDDGDVLLIVTNDGAPEFRLMQAPVAAPGREHWVELIGEDPAERLEAAEVFERHVVLVLRRDGNPLLRIVRRDGAQTAIDVHPGLEAAAIRLEHNEEYAAGTVLAVVESCTSPPAWFDVNLDTGARTPRKKLEVPGYDEAAYISERYAVEAVDGELIPVTVARRLDTPLDGSAPCLLWAYGAYESADWPMWDPTVVTLLDRGVVFAQGHVRGGGEMGRRWWLQGHLAHKQNTFSDLVALADGLADGLVDGDRIVTRGLSAGGLLQGAVFSQRPDRWAGVVAEVPFVDVITTMLDPSIPLTVNEWEEWGDPRRPEDFAWMLAYSPYDNLPPAGVRPPLLITGAVHDTRVLVCEPAKWTAALRASDPQWSPQCLFRAELAEGSHGGPSGRYAALHYEAEVYAWALERMGLS